jgi:glycosyltransferase involved in cell wall biosynthesis
MRKKDFLFTIITPSYNQGNFIEETLLSVKNQNYPFIEHIVIDGGSTDNTISLLKKYEKEYNLKWISETDEGQSDAINKGFKIAKGDFVGWLNSDDVFVYKNILSKIVGLFDKNEEIDIIYGDALVIDENNNIKNIIKPPKWNYSFLLYGGSFIVQPAAFFRKNIIKNNPIDKKLDFAMDIEFWLRLGKKYNFLYIPEIFAGDRLHKNIKRFDSSGTDKFRYESRKIREENGLVYNYKFHILHYVFLFYILFIRRISGIAEIFKIKKTNLAFNGRINNELYLLINQLNFNAELKHLYLNLITILKIFS